MPCLLQKAFSRRQGQGGMELCYMHKRTYIWELGMFHLYHVYGVLHIHMYLNSKK